MHSASVNKSIDLPGNKPLLLLQFTSDRTVQHSNSLFFFNNKFIKDQAENTYKTHIKKHAYFGLYLLHWMYTLGIMFPLHGSLAVKSKPGAERIVKEDWNMSAVKLFKISIKIRKVWGLWHEISASQEKVMDKDKKQIKFTQEEAHWESHFHRVTVHPKATCRNTEPNISCSKKGQEKQSIISSQTQCRS